MNFHVPTTDDAARHAAEKMLPSKALLSAQDFKPIHRPGQELVGGLYEASARVDIKKPPKIYETAEDAIRAYRRGEIDVDRRVRILQSKPKE